MKKNILLGLLVALMGLGLASTAEAGIFDSLFGGGKKKDDGKIKIGFLLKTMQEERYQKDKKYFMDAAYAAGADEVVFDSANNKEQMQLQKFETMLSKGVDVIVLQPVNTGTAGSMVKLAHEENVKVVGYDSMLVDGPLDIHVMQDSWAVGRLQGAAMLKWLKAKKGSIKGNVALIKGQPGDSNARAMSSGVLEVVKNNPGLKLVIEQSHEGWAPDKAMKTAENALSRYDNDIDAFVCNNSGMARGVIAALKGQGLADVKKVFVAGSDADLTNIRYVAQGVQAVEVFKKIKPLAESAAQVAVKLAKNKDKEVTALYPSAKLINNNFQDVPTIVTEIVEVTKGNIKDTVIADGFYTSDEVYGK